MNFGEEFSTPNEEFRWGSSWIPVTPQKPLPIKPHPSPVNPHGNYLQGASWQHQLTGIPTEHVQMGTRYNGMAQNFCPIGQLHTNGGLYGYDGSLCENNQMINYIAGSNNPGSFTQFPSSDGSLTQLLGNDDSFTQLLSNDGPRWTNRSMSQVLHDKAAYVASRTRNVSASVDMAVNTPLIPKMDSQVANQGNNNGSYPSNSQRNSNAFAWLFSNQNHCSSSNLLSNGDSSFQKSHYDIPIQVTSYDLNSSFTEAEAASCVAGLLQFTRDEPKNFENNQLSSVVNPLTNQSSSREKDKQMKLVMPTGDETIKKHGDELLQNIVESSSAAISTPYKENKDSDRESDRGIDLNKTPQQKTPKRRKHRPKVIRESKPRRAPKPTTPKNTESMENRPVKRKYERKNVQKESPSQLPVGTRETTDPNAGKVAKSCRRVLHFDSEKTMEENQCKVRGQQEEMQQGNDNIIDLTSDSEETLVSTATNQVFKTRLAQGTSLPNQLMAENKIPGSMSDSTPSRVHMSNNYRFLPEKTASAAHLATSHMNIQNLHVENGYSDFCRRRWRDGYTFMQQQQHSNTEGIGKDVTRAKTSAANLQKAEGYSESVPKAVSLPSEERGSKREHCGSIEQTNLCTNHPPSSLFCQEILEFDGHEKNSCTLRKEFSESHKKQKFEKGYLSIYDIRQIEECLGKVESRGQQHCVNSNGFTSELNHTILGPYIERQNKVIHKFTNDKHTQSLAPVHNFLNQQISTNSHPCREVSHVVSFSAHSLIEAFNQLPSSPPRKSFQPGNKQVLQNLHGNMSAKKQTALTKRKKRDAEPPISHSVSSGTDKFQQGQDAMYDYERPPSKAIGFPIAGDCTYIDYYIIDRFRALSLNGSCSQFIEHEQNALDGAVIPYEGVVKKRKPRPKVELDPETNRVWNLLMGKEGSQGMEGTDQKKDKYWEEERRVFQGRVESFIARMHLVQGDRRFSRWKGSVVDSVVGVFLTQNVSDHISSSAFMCLASRFPPPKVSNHQAEEDKVGTSILVTEPEVCMRSPDDASKWHEEISSQPIYNQISSTLHESPENQRHGETSGIGRNLVEAHCQCLEEEFVSSQDSFESSVTESAVGIRLYPIYNPEADHDTSCQTQNIDISIEANQKMEKAAMFQDFYREVNGSSLVNDGSKNDYIECEQMKSRSDGITHLSGTYSFTDLINLHNQVIQVPIVTSSNNHLHVYTDSGEPEPWRLGTFSEESKSSWPSTAFRNDIEKEKEFKSLSDDEPSGSVVNPSMEQNILLSSQEKTTKNQYASFRQHSTDRPSSSSGYNQPSYSSRQCEENHTVQLGNTSVREPVKHTEPLPRKKSDNMQQHAPNGSELKKGSFSVDYISVANKHMHKENQSVDSNLREELYTYGQSHKEANANVLKGRKAKTESEKKNAVDWDILRKQAQANGGKKERNKDAMDSLDYEALINANVKEISNVIRERGMNNMLAERIQEFLNRLVREHGSIDLEWLRDVPPDKAKDYLLSIRGLGLKSVECVRLLTLHHLAFPVDTNVGRIAVRLGWVPLQPLPESLQLHLLEMYPMLESIQKYLWPRLCKLDQLTLYELHYQMITFGKVFCTKSKPNCNACPMRGECRHFASAFASARFALPGPEETSLAGSSVPIAAEMNATITVTPMSLPPLENNSLKKAGIQINKCEPIIEEPATPEQHFPELLETDIEDFDDNYEDIPTIILNMKNFTETLQNYMEENMELQEVDMSKALVALSQEAASLPTPKLKDVSRLRTEHQVYELPDSHPLLDGMDRREPDDPSPYLLAIWTPGETADSTQPPESRCGAQNQNKLCNENTCLSCNSLREEALQTVRGTILIPCRTAMKGSFPLNGTYFQVNEMFADHASSLSPINVPRGWIWNLPRRTVYFGTSVSTIFKGLPTEEIQYCFWRGYVCVRAFDRMTRAPRPLKPRLHYPLSKLTKNKNEENT